MPKKNQPVSKAEGVSERLTEIRIPYILNSSQSEKQFVYQISQLAKGHARQIYRQRYPTPPNKGGRPSIQKLVWDAADQVWTKWGQQFPPKRSAFVHLLREVNATVIRKSRDPRTTTKFLKQWTECNLSFSQFPQTLIKLPPREGQDEDLLRLQFGLAAIGELAQSCGPDFADMLTKRKRFPVEAMKQLALRLGTIAAADHKALAKSYLSNRKK